MCGDRDQTALVQRLLHLLLRQTVVALNADLDILDVQVFEHIKRFAPSCLS